ncbi:hypothetical protein [Clostridium sardiniense]|uniref:hypothetical protein n=1 Tax=Clostridium sardiniense TaxID=29369 RepID=UPI001956D6E9|nr:hypothetical protein [Clostridium sardiniense]MBM7835701.1 DNA-directed RNA polymerase subunit RPC12/RpoP [Clostridium sardiniense]
MEKETLVKSILVKYICDYCNEGNVIPTGENYWEYNPPKFEHKCTKCGKRILLNDKYPLIRYRSLE